MQQVILARGANYTQGNLSLGTAYTQVDGATLNVQSLVGSSQAYTLGGKRNSVAGMGGSYRLNEQFLLHGMVTRSEFEGNTSSANGTFKNYFGGVVYQPTSFWKLGVDLNNTKLLNASYKQVALTADYRLSKRTDVYAQVVTQRAPRANMTCCISLREISEQRGPYDEQPATQGPNAFSQIFNSARRIARRP